MVEDKKDSEHTSRLKLIKSDPSEATGNTEFRSKWDKYQLIWDCKQYKNYCKSTLIEIKDSRNILKSLVIKNLIGRYKNSMLGFLWHFFTPIMMIMVYYIVFTEIRQSTIPNFWIYLATGLFPFNFMLSNLTNGCTCIISNSNMIKKMYFPRVIIPLAQVISSLIIMMIGYAIVIICILISGYSLQYTITLIIPIIVIMTLFVLGMVLLVSALTVYIRDIQYLLGSISMAFFFITPMYFTIDKISGIISYVIWINPFTYYVEAFHQVVYYGICPDIYIIGSTIALALASLIIGWAVFDKLKKGFVERL